MALMWAYNAARANLTECISGKFLLIVMPLSSLLFPMFPWSSLAVVSEGLCSFPHFLVSFTKKADGSSSRAYLSSDTLFWPPKTERIQISSFKRESGCLKQVAWHCSKEPIERDWGNSKTTQSRSKYSECLSGDIQRWSGLPYLAC